MQDILTIILLLILTLGVAVLIFLLTKKKDNLNDEKLVTMMERLKNLGDQNNNLRNEINTQNKDLQKMVDTKLSETHKTTQEQYQNTQNQLGQTMKTVQGITGESAKLISQVTEKLTKLDETNKQVVNFSAQLQNLQDILKNPKQRGVLGEYFLEETLKNVLPPNSYQMQYGFKNGDIVDAVVFVDKKIIPVDSKFSLENYERLISCSDANEREKLEVLFKGDLKKRIDETSKYVKPTENTMDFAFMFIPSEAIYYDLLVNKVGAGVNTRDLIEYAFKDRHVIIVSPTSFLAYLQTVLQGLRAMQIEENAKDIRKNVEKLKNHIGSYEEFMKKMGNSLGTTVNHYNRAYKEFKKIDKDVVRIAGGESLVEAEILDKPREQD